MEQGRSQFYAHNRLQAKGPEELKVFDLWKTATVYGIREDNAEVERSAIDF